VKCRVLLAGVLAATLQIPCDVEAQITAASPSRPVSGLVTDAVSGQPLAGVSVALMARAPSELVSKVVTDDSGRFGASGFPAGTYVVVATKAGYAPGSPGQVSYSQPGVPVVIDAGRGRGDIVIRLWRLPQILGRLEDARGRRLNGVYVVARRLAPVAGQTRLVGSHRAKTDDRGEFVFVDLPAGRYLISTEVREGDSLRSSVTAYYPGVASPAEAELIGVVPGDRRSDLLFHLPEFSVHTVSGTVSGAHDVLERGVDAVLVQTSAGRLGDVVVATTRIESSGRFAFRGVPAGAYKISILKFPNWPEPKPNEARPNRVFEIATSPHVGVFPSAKPIEKLPPGETVWADTAVYVSDRDVTDVTVDCFRGFVVSGRVVFKGGTAPPKDVLPTNYVSIRPADGRVLGIYPAGRVEPDGVFKTTGMPPGSYYLGMVSPFSGWSVESVLIGGRNAAGRSFSLDSDVSDVVVTLTQRPSYISGIVRDSSGQPAASSVVIFPEESRDWGDFANWLPARSVRIPTKGDGTFSVPVFPGRYLLVAMPQDLDPTDDWQTRSFLEGIAKAAISLEVREGELASRELRLSLVHR